jgi:hypothetical protein
VSLLVTFNNAIEGVIQNNPKARINPDALMNAKSWAAPACIVSVAAYREHETNRSWHETILPKTRHKGHQRHAWSPSRRGRGSTDRGAPDTKLNFDFCVAKAQLLLS